MRFKIDWASLVVGSKFTVFALFYFLFESNFPSTSPRGTYIWTGLRGLYTWRGLFSEFYGILGAYIVTYSENKDDSASSIRKRHLTVLEKIYIYMDSSKETFNFSLGHSAAPRNSRYLLNDRKMVRNFKQIQ